MAHPRTIVFGAPLHNRLGRLACVVLLCVACCGCLVIPIHHKPEMHGASGAPTLNKLDLTFLKVGTTSRQDVLDRLAWIDTGIGDDRFFFGRWKENSWVVSWMVGLNAGGSSELWDVHNLIVDFDEKAIVRQITHFPNRRMITELSARLISDPSHSLDLSAPVTLNVAYLHNQKQQREYGTLFLNPDAVGFVAHDPSVREEYNFETSPDNITRVTMNWVDPSEPGSMSEAIETIHFKRTTKLGRKITISLDLAGTVTLIKYLAQSQRVGGTSRATGNNELL